MDGSTDIQSVDEQVDMWGETSELGVTTEWRDNLNFEDATSEEGGAEVNPDVDEKTSELQSVTESRLETSEVETGLAATCPHCDVADEGDATPADQEGTAELAAREEWTNNPFWVLLRDPGYERW